MTASLRLGRADSGEGLCRLRLANEPTSFLTEDSRLSKRVDEEEIACGKQGTSENVRWSRSRFLVQ